MVVVLDSNSYKNQNMLFCELKTSLRAGTLTGFQNKFVLAL